MISNMNIFIVNFSNIPMYSNIHYALLMINGDSINISFWIYISHTVVGGVPGLINFVPVKEFY